MHNSIGKRALTLLAYVAGIYLVVRAIVEPFLINYSKPETYKHDWGGPTYIGVLAVHMGPGIISLVAYLYYFRKKILGKKIPSNRS